MSKIADYLDGKTTLGWDTPKGQHYRAIYAQTLRAIDAAVAEALKDTISLDAHEYRVDAAVAEALKERDSELANLRVLHEAHCHYKRERDEARREEREWCAQRAADHYKIEGLENPDYPRTIGEEIAAALRAGPPASAPETRRK